MITCRNAPYFLSTIWGVLIPVAWALENFIPQPEYSALSFFVVFALGGWSYSHFFLPWTFHKFIFCSYCGFSAFAGRMLSQGLFSHWFNPWIAGIGLTLTLGLLGTGTAAYENGPPSFFLSLHRFWKTGCLWMALSLILFLIFGFLESTLGWSIIVSLFLVGWGVILGFLGLSLSLATVIQSDLLFRCTLVAIFTGFLGQVYSIFIKKKRVFQKESPPPFQSKKDPLRY